MGPQVRAGPAKLAIQPGHGQIVEPDGLGQDIELRIIAGESSFAEFIIKEEKLFQIGAIGHLSDQVGAGQHRAGFPLVGHLPILGGEFVLQAGRPDEARDPLGPLDAEGFRVSLHEADRPLHVPRREPGAGSGLLADKADIAGVVKQGRQQQIEGQILRKRFLLKAAPIENPAGRQEYSKCVAKVVIVGIAGVVAGKTAAEQLDDTALDELDAVKVRLGEIISP